MSDPLFDTELITRVSGDDLTTVCRMTFTEHDLRQLSALLNAGTGAVGYHFTARTLSRHFVDTWRATREINGSNKR